MTTKKPVIGISASYVNHNHYMEGVYVHHDYHKAILAAGGIPIVLPVTSETIAEEFIALCDGLILSGGEDVSPEFYNDHPHPELGFTFPERDKVEFILLKKAMEKEIPILGICRGLQLINVAFGGTLIQDIPSCLSNPLQHVQKVKRQKASHNVLIEKESKLYELLNAESLYVNSLHHQCINTLGEGLRAVAYSPNDHIIEAFEHVRYEKLLAVQWHPESMAYESEPMQALFKRFVQDSQKR